MTTITTSTGPSYPPQATGTQTTQGSTGTQRTTAAGAASGTTGTVPAEIGQAVGQGNTTAGKPVLAAPNPKAASATKGSTPAEENMVGTARQKADATLDRAAMLREMRVDRRVAICAKAFSLEAFARVLQGPITYCMNNPGVVLTSAVTVGGAIACAMGGNFAALQAIVPAVGPVIAGIANSSGLTDMIQRGAELAMLTLGVDPKVSAKWGDAVGSAALVGVNVAANVINGTWNKIDFSLLGDFAADAAVLLNVPAKNAEAFGSFVSLAGTAGLTLGVGIVAGKFKGLTFANVKTIWDDMATKFGDKDYVFKLTDITNSDAFKAVLESAVELVADFGNSQKLIDAFMAMTTPPRSTKA